MAAAGFALARRRTFFLVAAAVPTAASARAQQTPGRAPARIAGTVERLDGETLAVRTLDGREVSVALPEGVRISAVANPMVLRE